MGIIQKDIEIFESLRKKRFLISVETGEKFVLQFKKNHFHHLMGFQHLTDKPHLSTQVSNKGGFYNALLHGKIKESDISSSNKYQNIDERILHFSKISDILCEGSGKIIIQYDPVKAQSDICARFLLYKRDGTCFGADFCCYSLFIGYDSHTKSYYPATFLVEHSNKYVHDQKMLDCTISIISKSNNLRSQPHSQYTESEN